MGFQTATWKVLPPSVYSLHQLVHVAAPIVASSTSSFPIEHLVCMKEHTINYTYRPTLMSHSAFRTQRRSMMYLVPRFPNSQFLQYSAAYSWLSSTKHSHRKLVLIFPIAAPHPQCPKPHSFRVPYAKILNKRHNRAAPIAISCIHPLSLYTSHMLF